MENSPVPVFGSHSSPPLQPPVAHEVGPGLVLKSQSRRPQIRPAFQSLGTSKVIDDPAAASQLVKIQSVSKALLEKSNANVPCGLRWLACASIGVGEHTRPDSVSTVVFDCERPCRSTSGKCKSNESGGEHHCDCESYCDRWGLR